jgi:tetratricopeptide (TPR) repeat protein
VTSYLGHYFRSVGNQERAIEYLQQALPVALDVGDLLLQISTNFVLGEAHHALGSYRVATQFFRQVIRSLQGDLAYERFGFPAPPGVAARQFLVICLADLGEFVKGLTVSAEGMRIAEAVDHPFTLVQMCGAVGRFYVLKGDFDKANPLLERALAFCRTWDIRSSFPGIASTLGYAYALAGRCAEALPLLERAVEQSTSMKRFISLSRRVAHLSEGYLLSGRLDDALPLAQRALDLAHEHKERGHQAWILRLLGEVAAHHEPPNVEEAEAHYRQALALAEELGMRLLIAHCHLGLGTLYAKIGRPEPARAELSAAIELYRAMDMTFWLTHAETALGQANEVDEAHGHREMRCKRSGTGTHSGN